MSARGRRLHAAGRTGNGEMIVTSEVVSAAGVSSLPYIPLKERARTKDYAKFKRRGDIKRIHLRMQEEEAEL